MKKTKSKRIVIALCMALVVLCCSFISVKNVKADGGIMDYNTVCWNTIAYRNSAQTEQFVLENTNYDHNNPSSALYILLHYVQYSIYNDLSLCYYFTALAMQSSGCSVVGIDYAIGFDSVARWSAYAFDGTRQWQNICYK